MLNRTAQAGSFALLLLAAAPDAEAGGAKLTDPSPAEFNAYWNGGKAELISYELQQARYGELHKGRAVTVFVTEPFSRNKQVKLDDPGRAGSDHVPVLKVNHTRKFDTGVYPYSMMTSVFTPIDGSPTLKVTTSSQEWCGHTFTQLNLREDVYQARIFSYFESEADREVSLTRSLLEDEIWTRIRTAPASLPTGKIAIIPSTTHQRLLHTPFKVERAVAKITASGGSRVVYEVAYQTLDRTLTIEFDRAFPYQIQGWTETYRSGWGPSAKRLTTRAVKSKTMRVDYWNKHSNVDRILRKQLDLPES